VDVVDDAHSVWLSTLTFVAVKDQIDKSIRNS
jgi:hypothetical protein